MNEITKKIKHYETIGKNQVEIAKQLNKDGYNENDIISTFNKYSFKRNWNGNILGMLLIILSVIFFATIKSTIGTFNYNFSGRGNLTELGEWVFKPFFGVSFFIIGLFLVINRGLLNKTIKYILLFLLVIFTITSISPYTTISMLLGIVGILILALIKIVRVSDSGTGDIIFKGISDNKSDEKILAQINTREWKGSFISIILFLCFVLFINSSLSHIFWDKYTPYMKILRLTLSVLNLSCLVIGVLLFIDLKKFKTTLIAITALSFFYTILLLFNELKIDKTIYPSILLSLIGISLIIFQRKIIMTKPALIKGLLSSVLILSMISIFSFTMEGKKITAIENDINSETTNINLYGKNLKEIPEKVFEIKGLKSLNIANNPISIIPKEIGKLENLETLIIRNTTITSLPDEIGNLKNLKILYIDNNRLTSLPKSISNLTNLTQLNLSNNNIEALPLSICKLSNLEMLWLSGNQLKYIPNEIENLSNLGVLVLANNSLEEINTVITNITHLNELNVSYNNIENLPDNISNLINLTRLDLSENNFTTFPENICDLKNLMHLNLGSNKIKEIPKDIKKLTNIEYILLYHNNISNLPNEIGLLKKLKRLNINNNQITEIPSKIKELGILGYDDIYGNNFSSSDESNYKKKGNK